MSNSDLDFLATLEAVIRDRLGNPDAGSYTASLAASGTRRIAQKVGEEGVELAYRKVIGRRLLAHDAVRGVDPDHTDLHAGHDTDGDREGKEVRRYPPIQEPFQGPRNRFLRIRAR